jgi:hypothetical protein
VYLAPIPHARLARLQVTQGGPGAVEVAVQDGLVGHRGEAPGYRQLFTRRVQSFVTFVTVRRHRRRSPSLPSVEACVVERVPATFGPFSIPDGVTLQCKRAQVRHARDLPDLPTEPRGWLEAERAGREEGPEDLAQPLAIACQRVA